VNSTKDNPNWEAFYVTYGGGTQQAQCYSIVWAEDYSQARKTINESIGNKFAFVCDEAGFEGQVEKYDLQEIPLQPQVREIAE
jgi:hypothetical protein